MSSRSPYREMRAASIPSGIVKVTGERFTALPSNHPLGHYFDALYLTGYYYTFMGVGQLITALLLLIPRTALLGAMLYFPMILNICVLTYAVRFEGTRIAKELVWRIKSATRRARRPKLTVATNQCKSAEYFDQKRSRTAQRQTPKTRLASL